MLFRSVLGALAGGDLFEDGQIEIVADDLCGNVYAWNAQGHLVFHEHSNPAFSGAPLKPFHTVRHGVRDRTENGFLASPVLARLNGHKTGPLDIIAAGEDRHIYAWQPEQRRLAGRSLPGLPPEGSLAWLEVDRAGNVLSGEFHRRVWPDERGCDNATGVETTFAWAVSAPPRGVS